MAISNHTYLGAMAYKLQEAYKGLSKKEKYRLQSTEEVISRLNSCNDPYTFGKFLDALEASNDQLMANNHISAAEYECLDVLIAIWDEIKLSNTKEENN